MRRVYGALLVAMLVVCRVCAESGRVGESRWLAGHMGFVWVHADSFLRCVASPFHSFVTTYDLALMANPTHSSACAATTPNTLPSPQPYSVSQALSASTFCFLQSHDTAAPFGMNTQPRIGFTASTPDT